MANYSVIKAAIEEVIKANGNNEITGQLLQNSLIAMINALGADFQFAGVATPETDPGTPDQNVAYLAGPGTYPNFGPTTVKTFQIGIFKYNGTWSYSTVDIVGFFININEIANHPAAYADAATALADVPVALRKKGVKCVYYDDTTELWIEMLCVDDAGVNWWTDVENNWVIEGPIVTKIATATGGQQLNIAGEKRGNLDDVLNVNVWNEQVYAYDSAALARAAVPANKRKLGGVITYMLDDGWHTEQFIGTSTSNWTTNANWRELHPLAGYQYMGVATPSTQPGTPIEKVFYIGGAGTYNNFGTEKIVNDGCIGLFVYSGEWTFTNIPVAVSYFQLCAGLDPKQDIAASSFNHLMGIIDLYDFRVLPGTDLQGYKFKIQYISFNDYSAGKFYFQLRASNDNWITQIYQAFAVAKSSLRRGEIIEGKVTMPTINIDVYFKVRISNDFAAGSSFANTGNSLPLNITNVSIFEVNTNETFNTINSKIQLSDSVIANILHRLNGKIVDDFEVSSSTRFFENTGIPAGSKINFVCNSHTGGSADMYLYRSNNTYVSFKTQISTGDTKEITVDEDFAYMYLYISSATVNGTLSLLLSGVLPESYETTIAEIESDIQDILPQLPNKVEIASSNLLDYDSRLVGYTIASNGEIAPIILSPENWCLVNFAFVKGLSKIIFGINGVAGRRIYNYAFYDANKNYIANSYVYSYESGTITVIDVPAGAVYFCATVSNYQTKDQINAGETILPYEEYYRYFYTGTDKDGFKWIFKPDPNDTDLIKKINDIVENGPEYQITPFVPEKIYSVCNDMSNSTDIVGKRNYTLNLYADHLFILDKPQKVFFKKTKCDKLPIYPKFQTYPNVVFNEDGSNVKITEKNIEIDGIVEPITFNQVTTRTSHVANGFPKILCIGDSVTEGYLAGINGPYTNSPYAYWAWIMTHFMFDQHQANDASKYKALMIGHKNVVSFQSKYYDGTMLNGRACAEGKGGASLNSYLTAQYHGSGSGETDDRLNPFYNPDKEGTVKFSVEYWLNRYRTMDNNGNRLYFDANQSTTGNAGETNIGYLADGTQSGFYIGSAVTNTMAYDVCEPTHIIVQLGYNDSDNDQYTINMQTLLSIIKQELPNCFVGLSLPDCPGTYFPELYPQFNRDDADQYPVSYFMNPARSSHAKFNSMNRKIKALENINDKIYYIPNFFISPTAESAPVRVSQEAEFLSTESDKDRFFIQSYSAPNLHPNNHAHAVWGYENYAWIKYTLSL